MDNKMRHDKVVFRLLVGVALATGAGLAWWWTQLPAARSPSSRHLKVITFNVQFLPGVAETFNKRPDAAYRARAIAGKLADYDIIGLNEVFHATHRKTLLEEFRKNLGERFHGVTASERDRSVFGVDGGLVIVSRWPIVASHSMTYGTGSSILKHGLFADEFAAKGALHARIASGKTDSDCLDVFVTHLESVEARIRDQQYGKLADFIRSHADPARPVLILGDFNTTGDAGDLQDPQSQYHRMVAGLTHGCKGGCLTDLWPTLGRDAGGTSDPDRPDGGNRIDYIFVANPSPQTSPLRPTAVRVNRLLDPRVTSLSDHAAVEAELEWLGR
jgi:endonuclease/exonuclease/phosphatase family metal-dependent hydrolase